MTKRYISALYKSEPIVEQYTSLCSQHFTDADYDRSFLGKPILKPYAILFRFFNSKKSLVSGIQYLSVSVI